MAAITLNVNGKEHTLDVHPDTPLLWVLRETLGLSAERPSMVVTLASPTMDTGVRQDLVASPLR